MRTGASRMWIATALLLSCGGGARERHADEPVCDKEGLCRAATAPSSGDTRWVRQFGSASREQIVALATRSDGVTVALTRAFGLYDQTTLVWLGLDGELIALRTFAGAVGALRSSIAFAPDGDLYLWVTPMAELIIPPRGPSYPDFGGGRISGSTVVRLSPTGEFRWQRAFPNRPDSAIAVDADGGFAVSTVDTQHNDQFVVHRCDANGALLWSRSFRATTKGAFGPDGGLYVAESAYYTDGTASSLGAIYKLDESGETVWQSNFSGGPPTLAYVRFDAIGTSRLGTVAVTGPYYGSVSFAGATLTSPESAGRAFVAAVEGYGAPRFLLQAGGPPFWGSGQPAASVVHPDGTLAIVVDDMGTCGFSVQLWGLDGVRRWEKEFAAASCGWRRTTFGISMTPDGDILAGGLLMEPIDLGLGLLESHGGEDGFVQALAH